MQAVRERTTTITTRSLFVDLEWAVVDDDHARTVLADERLAFAKHHLETLRRTRPHLLTEPEETVLSETSVVGADAWVRLFEEQTSAIEVTLPDDLGGARPADAGVVVPAAPRTTRSAPLRRRRSRPGSNPVCGRGRSSTTPSSSTAAWTTGCVPTRAGCPARNLANEASDESVDALIRAVVARYDIPQRWYALKARVLGVDRLADYDRGASVATSESTVGWAEAAEIVRDAYASFSPELAGIVGRFIDERWIDAPLRPGKRGGAFCAYAVSRSPSLRAPELDQPPP